MGKFVIRRTQTGFIFDLRAGNGEGILCSEVYTTAAACRKGIQSVIRCAGAPVADLTAQAQGCGNPRFELYTDRAGEYRFRLRSRNGKVIAVSQSYSSRAACENGIESVRQNVKNAEICELISNFS